MNSVLSESFEGNILDLVFLVLNGTGMVPVYYRRDVSLFASNEIGVRLEGTVVLRVVTALWDNGLYDLLSDYRTSLDLRSDEGMEVMTLAGGAPGVCLPPWLPGLSSCLCIVVIKGPRVYAIVSRRSYGAFLHTGSYDRCHGCRR